MARAVQIQVTLNRNEVGALLLVLDFAHGPAPVPVDGYPVMHALRERLRGMAAAMDEAVAPKPAVEAPEQPCVEPAAALADAVERGDGAAARTAGAALAVARGQA